ncbi:MAG: hypothetical protein QNJ94_18550 [Alphaproteobacteria bacterium]|nr:hypothetical protein [Alphaproteobacteria bacterium]
MAYNRRDLVSLGGQAGHRAAPNLWSHGSTDELDTQLARNYISDVGGTLHPGDRMLLGVKDNGDDPAGFVEIAEAVVQGGLSGGAVALREERRMPGAVIRIPFFIDQTDLLAGTAQYLLCPVRGRVFKLVTVVKKQVTTGGTITASIDGTAIPGVSVTVANSAAVGTVGTSKPTAGTAGNKLSKEDQVITVTPSAAFATAGEVFGWVEVIPSTRADLYYSFFFFNQTDLLAGTSQWMPCPYKGTVRRLGGVVQLAVTTGGAIGVELGGTDVDGIDITVADAAAAGTVYTQDATGTNDTLNEDTAIEVTAAAAFATAGRVNGYVAVEPSETFGRREYVQFLANQTDVLAGTSHYLVAPCRGEVRKALTAVQADVGTGGDITVELATVAVAGLTCVVANSASAGDIDKDVGTVGDDTAKVQKYDPVEVVFEAAFATSGAINGVLEFAPH